MVRHKQQFEALTCSRIDQVFQLSFNIDLCLIDIPIGLGSYHVTREVETLARMELRPLRHASVFTPPVREALNQTTYAQACEVNQKITGKKISIQCWNIVPKIREVDRLVRTNPDLQQRLLESHPEIAFKYLNHGNLPVLSKREAKRRGLDERLAILAYHCEGVKEFYREELKKLDRSTATADDLLDALCLCIAACGGRKWGLNKLQEPSTRDDHFIPMNMYYFDP